MEKQEYDMKMINRQEYSIKESKKYNEIKEHFNNLTKEKDRGKMEVRKLRKNIYGISINQYIPQPDNQKERLSFEENIKFIKLEFNDLERKIIIEGKKESDLEPVSNYIYKNFMESKK